MLLIPEKFCFCEVLERPFFIITSSRMTEKDLKQKFQTRKPCNIKKVMTDFTQ